MRLKGSFDPLLTSPPTQSPAARPSSVPSMPHAQTTHHLLLTLTRRLSSRLDSYTTNCSLLLLACSHLSLTAHSTHSTRTSALCAVAVKSPHHLLPLVRLVCSASRVAVLQSVQVTAKSPGWISTPESREYSLVHSMSYQQTLEEQDEEEEERRPRDCLLDYQSIIATPTLSTLAAVARARSARSYRSSPVNNTINNIF